MTETTKDIINRLKDKEVAAGVRRDTVAQRYISRIALITEVGRLMWEVVPTLEERDILHKRLLAALDYSDIWVAKQSSRPIGELLETLRKDEWRDVTDEA